MNRLKSAWKRLPSKPRRILTFIAGMLVIVIAGAIGPIPGPGGTVLFLLGIAILATEFTWAERVRDTILHWLKHLTTYIRTHPYKSALLILIAVGIIATGLYFIYTKIL